MISEFIKAGLELLMALAEAGAKPEDIRRIDLVAALRLARRGRVVDHIDEVLPATLPPTSDGPVYPEDE